MTFRRKIDDSTWPISTKQLFNPLPVADIAVNKHVALILIERCEIGKVPRIGQLVEVDDRLIVSGQPLKNKIGADKTGATCHHNHGSVFLVFSGGRGIALGVFNLCSRAQFLDLSFQHLFLFLFEQDLLD